MGQGNDNDRYVVPNAERGGWDVVKEDHERASAHADTKKEAVDRAREIVENLGGGEVRQANRNGRFGDSDTTKHGRESRTKDTK
jgi:predicted RNase H-like HicB family nuclease